MYSERLDLSRLRSGSDGGWLQVLVERSRYRGVLSEFSLLVDAWA